MLDTSGEIARGDIVENRSFVCPCERRTRITGRASLEPGKKKDRVGKKKYVEYYRWQRPSGTILRCKIKHEYRSTRVSRKSNFETFTRFADRVTVLLLCFATRFRVNVETTERRPFSVSYLLIRARVEGSNHGNRIERKAELNSFTFVYR